MSPDDRDGTQRQLEATTKGFLTLQDGQRSSCNIQLRYRARDPLAVAVAVSGPGAYSGLWILSRDLLSAGLSGTAGIGDVAVRPEAEPGQPMRVVIRVPGQRGKVEIRIDHQTLLTYLEYTHAMRPFGSEMDDRPLDEEIKHLLDDE
ncbi:SsgA family sporulation/cell division regulator [Streptomyces sp. NPDC058293]|uniref:SsgA family sporulation/cell division regulator n=1 Tax=Streptomyces sp. NPDC058293 TaxID=3346429 RepID=UPI0036E53809